MLYLVATPIGNLADISLRALEVLKDADLILCEDTRHSQKLLHHYEIKKPTASYHKFNEQSQIEQLIEKLKAGVKICLISDAGTPLISDPGMPLVQACVQADIEITAIPGACALIQALVLSGFVWERFQFIGFLPKKEKEMRALFQEALVYPGITIGYVAPHSLLDTLTTLAACNPQAKIALAKELTKIHETIYRGTAQSLLQAFKQESAIKGEYVLMVQGEKAAVDYSSVSVEEHVQDVQEKYQVSKREAIKIVAELRGLSKRDLYRTFHQN